MKNRRLTIKQRKFADNYITLGNATEAAERAGYSKGSARFIGSENLTKPNIKSYIDKKIEEISDKEIAKAEEVMKYLTSLMRGEEEEQTLLGLGGGEQEITPIKVSAKDRIKAAELLGKRYAMFTDNKNIDVKVPTIIFDIEDDEDGED